MIEHLSIKNFKSIKELDLDCKRVNLFIGEPNAGKSNILEALGLINWYSTHNTRLKEFVRFQTLQNLFYDDILETPIEIQMDNPPIHVRIDFNNNNYNFESIDDLDRPDQRLVHFSFTVDNDESPGWSGQNVPNKIHFYRFLKQTQFNNQGASYLEPPMGSNLFSIVMQNRKCRDIMASFLKKDGFKLILKPQTSSFEFQKQIDDIAISYPYTLLSDTIQRIIFYIIAIESNKDSTLVFEEPESHAFPYYTKYLGEKIGMDERNQYFIATHNPYLLNSILEKTKEDSVAVFVTYFSEYQTKVKSLSKEEISELMSHDPFFNLESFIQRD